MSGGKWVTFLKMLSEHCSAVVEWTALSGGKWVTILRMSSEHCSAVVEGQH